MFSKLYQNTTDHLVTKCKPTRMVTSAISILYFIISISNINIYLYRNNTKKNYLYIVSSRILLYLYYISFAILLTKDHYNVKHIHHFFICWCASLFSEINTVVSDLLLAITLFYYSFSVARKKGTLINIGE